MNSAADYKSGSEALQKALQLAVLPTVDFESNRAGYNSKRSYF